VRRWVIIIIIIISRSTRSTKHQWVWRDEYICTMTTAHIGLDLDQGSTRVSVCTNIKRIPRYTYTRYGLLLTFISTTASMIIVFYTSRYHLSVSKCTQIVPTVNKTINGTGNRFLAFRKRNRTRFSADFLVTVVGVASRQEERK